MKGDLTKLLILLLLIAVPGSMALVWDAWLWAFDHTIGWALRDALNGIADSVKPKPTPHPAG